MVDPVGVALPTLRRLPLYLRLFDERRRAGEAWLSSETMSRCLGLSAIQIRKDLSSIGALGSPKRGFPVEATAATLGAFLRADEYASAFLIGAGSLAQALLDDESIGLHGFEIAALFHPAPALAGTRIGGREVLPLSKLPDLSRRMGIRLAILAVEPAWVDSTLEVLAASSVAGLVDLTGSSRSNPEGMVVLKTSFGASLAALAGELRKGPGKA